MGLGDVRSVQNNIIVNYSLDEIGWTIYEKANIDEWDVLTQLFIEIVNKYMNLCNDNYIKRWYKAAVKVFEK
jgi:hypothetical protein